MQYARLTALVTLLILAGCGSLTTPTIATVDAVPTHAPAGTNVAPPRYILCSQDPLISYSAPKPGQEEDRANAFDSPETIGADAPRVPARGTIRYHNAAVKAACNGD